MADERQPSTPVDESEDKGRAGVMRDNRFGTNASVLRTTQKELSEAWKDLKRLQASEDLTKLVIRKSRRLIQDSYAALNRTGGNMPERKNS
jgi:hypothetical protein